MEPAVAQLQQLIDQSNRITFFTGAGISTESGIPDFRSQNGLYKQNMNFADVVSRPFFERRPKEFWPLFKDIFRIKMLHEYKPNRGHEFIARLEETGKQINVITQNIDGLHQDAGSSNVYEIHGTIKSAHCPKCYAAYDLFYLNEHDLPRCQGITRSGKDCNMILKPDVVLFGDSIHHFEEAIAAALMSDLFIVMGSSLDVTPINQIPLYVNDKGNIRTVIINRDATRFDHLFDLVIHDSIGSVVSQLKIS
ncbi:NAD-dependent protein deacylase [Bacillus songklensis]|uniref:NAD-dependent protein deacetylase n=1 Tax=Bacillus songklensis TaxID=1069116 RepID=A0ABV8B5J1_9BACI